MKPLALLINPPIYDFALYDLFVKPFGLLKIGAGLEKSGYRVKMINSLDYREPVSTGVLGKTRRYGNGTGKFFRQETVKPALFKDIPKKYCRYGILTEILASKIKQEQPDIILVTSGMTYWYPGVKEAVELCKTIHPDVPLIAGGIYATLCTDHCRKNIAADYIVKGDAFPQLSQILTTCKLPPYSHCEDDLLILPELYEEAAVIRLNNGCPFNCGYCASKSLVPHFQKGDPIKSFELVKKIHNLIGTVNFAFYDDALLAAKNDVIIPFLKLVKESELNIRFYLPNAIHLSYIDPELAVLMYQTGFQELRLGFESSNEEFHNTMGKKFGLKEFKDKVSILHKAGFSSEKIALYILAGLPGQDHAEVEESIIYAGQLGLNVYLSDYSPVPGSPLWENCLKLSQLPLEEEPMAHNNTVFPMQNPNFTPKHMESLKKLTLTFCRNR